jgi:uncharacterized membrane protein YozB (DUF420 family)
MRCVEHDDLLIAPASPTAMSIWRALRLVIIAGLGIFVTFAALRAISESWDNDGFPEALAVKLELLPLIFPVHMIAGGLALLLVPLTLSLRGTRWHRVVGRLTAVDIVVAGLTAIPVALDQPVTLVSAAGFTMQAVTWVVLLGLGIWNIRRGHVARHRAAMLMMAAVTSGALFFRLYLALWKLLGVPGHFKTFYAFDAWVAWMLPLTVVALVLKFGRLKNPWLRIQTSTR